MYPEGNLSQSESVREKVSETVLVNEGAATILPTTINDNFGNIFLMSVNWSVGLSVGRLDGRS